MIDRELPSVGLMDRVRVVGRHEGLIDAYVPLELISREGVAVDETHVRDLAKSISLETNGVYNGQLSPIILGDVAGRDKFAIIDGFHRTPALESLGRTEAYCTIKENCTWENVIDLRITSTSTHKIVRFPRLIGWMTESWSFSPWSDKITVNQAFAISVQNSTAIGKKLGLDADDVSGITDWVNVKCTQWKYKPGSIARYLSIAKNADPELVSSVRDSRESGVLNALTTNHIAALSSILPEQYEFQRLVASVVDAENLTIPKTRILATFISQAGSALEARRIISTGMWRSVTTVERARGKKEKTRFSETQELIDKIFETELEIARLSIENAVLSGRYKFNLKDSIENLPSAQREVARLRLVEGFSLADTARILGKEINNVKVLQSMAIGKLIKRDAVDVSHDSVSEPFELVSDLLAQDEKVITSSEIEVFGNKLREIVPVITAFLRSKGMKPERIMSATTEIIIDSYSALGRASDQPNTSSSDEIQHLLISTISDVLSKFTEEDPRKDLEQRNVEVKRITTIIGEIEDDLRNKDKVKNYLSLLPATSRRDFVLAEFFGLAPFEIAKVRNVNLTGVTRSLAHARALLLENMVEDYVS